MRPPALSRPGAGAGLKPALREKFVSVYEDVFEGRSPLQAARDQGFAGRQGLQRFWDELLLLKVNEAYLTGRLSRLTEEELVGRQKSTVSEIFGTCVRYLSDGNFIRVAHALETLSIFLREILRKRFNEQGLTVISLVAGSIDHADTFFKRLFGEITSLLVQDNVPCLLKALGLRMFLVILMATENINTNSVASFFFTCDIFNGLISVLTLKIPQERKRLEFDATLCLLLLLLWKESPNAYASKLSSPMAPILTFLNTTASLLSRPSERRSLSTSRYPAVASAGPTTVSATEAILAYVNSWLGVSNCKSQDTAANGTGASHEMLDCDIGASNTTAATLLIYFLFHLNPLMRSQNAWSPSGFVQVTPGGASSSQLSHSWGDVFKAFITLSTTMCQQSYLRTPSGALKGKLSLIILRMFIEDHTANNFISNCDPKTYAAISDELPLSNGAIPPGPSRNMACFFLDLASQVLAIAPPMDLSHLDADLYTRAAELVCIILLKNKPFSSTSCKWQALWQNLIFTCRWCTPEITFQKPDVPEVAGLIVALMESSLGLGSDLLAATEEVERMHSIVISQMTAFEGLLATAERFPSPKSGPIKLVNIAALRQHYEVQVAAMGVQGVPSQQQALAAVRKKGTTGLKLKNRHAGPMHTYSEGTKETRILHSLLRTLTAQQRQLQWASTPKFELEAM
eukprot:SM000089S23857  [mRNA]  locus=s89:383658:387362:+ [translate_table: standard]